MVNEHEEAYHPGSSKTDRKGLLHCEPPQKSKLMRDSGESSVCPSARRSGYVLSSSVYKSVRHMNVR